MTRHDFLKLLAATPFGLAATPNSGSPPRTQSSAAGTRFPESVTAAVVDFITRWPPDRVPAGPSSKPIAASSTASAWSWLGPLSKEVGSYATTS
jgi:hypothetical protein